MTTDGPKLHAYNTRAIAELVPYDRNARTHSPEQVEQIAASIAAFGFTNPVLIDEGGGIIAGHGRVLAAAHLGWSQVPCLVLEGLSANQRRQLVLADNKLALNAGWDLDVLRAELGDLQALGEDLGVIGFSVAELDDLFTVEAGGGGPGDEAPALQAVARSVLGDVWEMGPHRLVVGDACLDETYVALLGTERVDICWTDPPYNVNYEAGAGKIKNDNLSNEDFGAFLRDLFVGVFAVLRNGGAIYCAHADTEGLAFRAAFSAAGFKLSGCIIWKKDALVLGRSDYQWIHEPILYGWKPGAAHRWFGGRKNTTVAQLPGASPFTQMADGRWQVQVGDEVLVVDGAATVEAVVPSLLYEPRPRSSTEHPTMKPVALVERMLRHNARRGDLVLDPCAGSGSTLVAADRLGMSARVIELDPLYADVIVRRWQAMSGRQALLRATNEPFGD